MRAFAAVFTTILALFIIPQTQAVDLRHFDDATLRSIQFVDANQGWAVGDDGVVWHTDNGGAQWTRQATGLRASLRSVHFIVPYQGIGWIAGREEQAGGSVGVLLFTRDGGKTWQRQLPNALPGLNQVRFIDAHTGFLLGDGCDQFSSGVFKTTDAGRSWEPVKGPRTSSWVTGDYQDAHTGVLAGAWSRLASFRKDSFGTAQVDPLDGRSILGLQVTPQRILAVGQGGLILSSQSAGQRWGFVDTKLPRELLANLDFHAIHGVEQKVWIVGRPGSVVLASDDQGATWKLHKTGQTLPLHGLFFFDAQNGWAVGDAGTILRTGDGGQSWTVQHQSGKRAAAMLIHAQAEQLHVDTLARLAAEQGYFAAAVRCIAPAANSSAWPECTAPQRFAAAVRQAGGLTGETFWQFPLPQYLAPADKQLVLDYWNQLHGGDVDRQLLRQLVLAVRIWRPSVVISDGKYPNIAGSPAAALISEALQEALIQASDRQAFPEQIAQLGLEPWRPTRFYTAADRKNAQVVLDANEIGTRLENSYRDFARTSARILGANLRLPGERFYRLTASAPDSPSGQRQLMDGISSTTGDARRPLAEEKEVPPARLKVMQARRNLIALSENLTNPGLLLTQIAPVIDGMADEDGAATVFAVGENFVRQGQWLLAREAFMLMADKYPTQPLSAEACRWLIRHASSSEARRRHELGQFLTQTNSTFTLKNPPKEKEKKPTRPGQDIIAQTNMTYLGNADEARQWYRGSLEIGKRLAALGSLHGSDPAIQFCLQSSRRQLGEADAVRAWLGKFVEYSPRGPWHDAASTELMLLGKAVALAPGKRLAVSKRSAKKPVLDGAFDDVCWQNNAPLILENAAGDSAQKFPTKAWFAHDQEYLYIALSCQHPAGMQVEPIKNRSRDAQLDGFDRVSIMLDLDRDYSTFFHLQIDQRGCVREECWGDVSWNPKWYVAVKSTAEAWHIEAAMPLSELSGEPLTAASAWACNVVRIVPGRGVQAWSLPADVRPRAEGMGILMFR